MRARVVYRERLLPWGPLARKMFHLASPAFLVYYAMPPDAWTSGFMSRQQLVLSVLVFFVVGEGVRVGLGLQVFGFRDYEARQLSAFTWAALGLALALLLFPMEFVIPSLLAVAWVDPLCSTCRHRGWYPWVPLLAAVALVGGVLGLEAWLGWSTLPAPALPLVGALGGGSAVLAEAPRWRWVDDDFRTLMVPLVLMTLAGLVP